MEPNMDRFFGFCLCLFACCTWEGIWEVGEGCWKVARPLIALTGDFTSDTEGNWACSALLITDVSDHKKIQWVVSPTVPCDSWERGYEIQVRNWLFLIWAGRKCMMTAFLWWNKNENITWALSPHFCSNTCVLSLKVCWEGMGESKILTSNSWAPSSLAYVNGNGHWELDGSGTESQL